MAIISSLLYNLFDKSALSVSSYLIWVIWSEIISLKNSTLSFMTLLSYSSCFLLNIYEMQRVVFSFLLLVYSSSFLLHLFFSVSISLILKSISCRLCSLSIFTLLFSSINLFFNWSLSDCNSNFVLSWILHSFSAFL